MWIYGLVGRCRLIGLTSNMIIFPTSSNNVEVVDDPLVWVVFVLPISKLNLNITFLVVPQKLAENILFLVNKKSP